MAMWLQWVCLPLFMIKLEMSVYTRISPFCLWNSVTLNTYLCTVVLRASHHLGPDDRSDVRHPLLHFDILAFLLALEYYSSSHPRAFVFALPMPGRHFLWVFLWFTPSLHSSLSLRDSLPERPAWNSPCHLCLSSHPLYFSSSCLILSEIVSCIRPSLLMVSPLECTYWCRDFVLVIAVFSVPGTGIGMS